MNQITESLENMSFHENILLTGRSNWPTGSQERPMPYPWINKADWCILLTAISITQVTSRLKKRKIISQ